MSCTDRVDPKVRTMIDELQELAGWNQAAIAKAIGVSRGRICQIVNKTNPSDLKPRNKEALAYIHRHHVKS